MLRAALGLLILLVTGVWVTGRLSPRPAPADLRYVNSSDVHTLDPARMSWTQDLRLGLNLWEGLCAYDPSSLAPGAGSAEFPPEVSVDGLTWVFHLREDARWSNGDLVTADDFVRGWRRAIEPGTAADYERFVTDQVAGAADYVSWRGQAVAALTALSRRAEEWTLDERALAALLTADCAEPVREALRSRGMLDAQDRALDAEAVSNADVPWTKLHREALHRHAARMDERFAGVGLYAVDPRTLIVHLVRPCPYFTDLAAFPALSPIHRSIELLADTFDGVPLTKAGLVTVDPQWTKPDFHRNGYPGLITNGAYRLTEWRFKQSMRIEVNPYYRDAGRVECRSIEAVVYEDPNTALLAYEAGDVDFIPTVEVSYDHHLTSLARSGERPDFHVCQLAGTLFFNFNCEDAAVDGNPNPFVDARVRLAFTRAVDREAIVESVLQRGDRAASSFIPPGALRGYDPPRGAKFDVAEARRQLSEAGYPDGANLPTVELLFSTSAAHGAVCQSMARMWEENLGVRVELVGKESKTFAEDKASRRFMIARANWYADYDDPTTFLDVLTTGNGNNDSGYSSAEFDRLMEMAKKERDGAARMQLLQQAERLVVLRDCPILPLLHYSGVSAIQPRVQGLVPNARLLFPFRRVSVSR